MPIIEASPTAVPSQHKDIEELRTQFAAIAISAAEKVINQSLDKEKHHKLIGEVLEEAKFK